MSVERFPTETCLLSNTINEALAEKRRYQISEEQRTE